MEWNPASRNGDSPAEPVDRIAFDLLRTIVGARQAAMPTVQIVAGRADKSVEAKLSSIDLLNGRVCDSPTAPGPNAFRGHVQSPAAFAQHLDQPVSYRSEEK